MFGAAGGVGEICENILQLAYVQPKELISPAALQHFTTQKSSSIFPGFTGCCHTRVVETYQIVIKSSLPYPPAK